MCVECEQSTQIDELQDGDVKVDLFTSIKSPNNQTNTKENKVLESRINDLDNRSSDLSNTNEIIACAVILPQKEEDTKKSIQQSDVKEIQDCQDNMVLSDVSNSTCKTIECKDDIELHRDKVEREDVNPIINVFRKKTPKVQQPVKRRGRPKKIQTNFTGMVDIIPNQHESIPLEGIESNLSTFSKKYGRVDRSSHEGLGNSIPKEITSCIDSIEPSNESQISKLPPLLSVVVEHEEIKETLIDLQPSSTISTSLKKEGNDVLINEDIHMHRRKLGGDGKPRNRAVMDILGLGVEMPKVERVFTRKKSFELSASCIYTNNNNNVTTFSTPLCKPMQSQDSNELIDNKSMVLHQPSKRGRGRPRKWPLKAIEEKDDFLDANVEDEIISSSTHELYTNFHGKRTSRKNLPGNKSLGCARCSIMGWTWRRWTRNGAKQRLRQKIQEITTSNVSFRSTANVISTLQSARTNRATLRKLVSAAEGSDKMKFNQLKVWFIIFQQQLFNNL